MFVGHSFSLYIYICCVKVDFTNAFNECYHTPFLSRLKKELPELFARVQWTYHTAGEVRFGAGVQQGDPLGPLLFSFVLLQFLDLHCHSSGLKLQLWHLDDSSFIGTRESVAALVDSLVTYGPEFGLQLNLAKGEVFWPIGDWSFPELHHKSNASSQHKT